MSEVSLDILNDDCLLYILNYLALRERLRVESVSKRWQRLCHILWRTTRKLCVGQFSPIDDNSFRLPVLIALPPLLKLCGQNLRSLIVRPKQNSRDKNVLDLIINYCDSLTSLNLADINVTDLEVRMFCTKFNSLTELRLTDIPLNDDQLKNIYIFNPSLQTLELNDLYMVYNTNFDQLNERIETIILKHSQDINDKELVRNLQKLKHLKKLHMTACCDDRIIIKDLVESIPQIEDLKLKRFYYTTDLHLLSNLKYLQSLQLQYDFLVNDETLAVFVRKCPLLQVINISGCNVFGYERLTCNGIKQLRYLPQLKTIYMNQLSQVNDEVVENLARNGKLIHVELEDCTVGDDGAIAILKLCPYLQKLVLRNCQTITLETVYEAIKVTKKRLASLNLCIDLRRTFIREEDLPEIENSCLKIMV